MHGSHKRTGAQWVNGATGRRVLQSSATWTLSQFAPDVGASRGSVVVEGALLILFAHDSTLRVTECQCRSQSTTPGAPAVNRFQLPAIWTFLKYLHLGIHNRVPANPALAADALYRAAVRAKHRALDFGVESGHCDVDTSKRVR